MKDLDLLKIFDAMKVNGISEVIIKEGSKIYEVRRGGFKQNVVAGSGQPVQNTPVMAQPVSSAVVNQPVVSEKNDVEVKNDGSVQLKCDLYELKSPLVGTYYSSPKPGAPSFVEIGDKVKKGQKLCIVEAMKTFNEIDSEVDGTIEEICVKNEELVEFGKVLFRIKLS